MAVAVEEKAFKLTGLRRIKSSLWGAWSVGGAIELPLIRFRGHSSITTITARSTFLMV